MATANVNGLPEIKGHLKQVSFRGHSTAQQVVHLLVEQGASFYLELVRGADYNVYVLSGHASAVETMLSVLSKRQRLAGK